MATDTASAASDFKDAFFRAAQVLFENDESTAVAFGHPGADEANFNDWVCFADLESDQTWATSDRGRDETLRLTVWISAFRNGGFEAEQVASQRAYAMLRELDYYARRTDTTLADTVQECALIKHTSTGATDPELLEHGRLIEIEAEFEATVRIRGSR